ncbi:MAG: leucine-rich repeat domain-containing protein, partial [Bacteroidales bacterium]|nr:leucine-rich repeat domain-containing protein [Bacteroidales bacterium]
MRKGLLLICAILCTNVLLAQDFFMVGNLGYNITGSNTVEVSYCDYDVLSVIIPATVTNYENGTIHTYNVTSIGIAAFRGCQLLAVTIPNSVTTIDSAAFESCSNLISVTIPNSVTSIGSTAFESCTRLTSVTIGNSVTSIGRWAFNSCTNLTSITIPNSVTYIGSYAFYECSDLTSVTIPNSVTFIEEGVFSNCSSLTSVTIPNSVTSIGNSAFYNCKGLTSVKLSNSVDTIGREAFYNTGLTSITIPENVRHIGSNAFGVDQYDESGNIIQSSLTTVVWNAKNVSNFYSDYNAPFSRCNNISTVTFGDSVKVIPNYIFYGCSSLTSVNIGNNVSTVGDYAFDGCTGLTSVTLSNSVDTIGREAFYNTGLTSITIPENVKHIGNNAFGVAYSRSSSLTTVVWNAKNATIGTNNWDGSGCPFSGCYNISTVTFGDSVRVIPHGLFTSISEDITPNVYYGRDIESWIDIKRPRIPGYVYNLMNNYNLYVNNQLVTNLVIPNTIDTIQDYTFYHCNSIQSVTIPKQIEFIGTSAFGECGNLSLVTWNAINCGTENVIFDGNITNLVLGDSVQVIPNYAFRLFGITNVNLPNSLTTIGAYAFAECGNLASITIPSQVTSIGNAAFGYCINMTNITMQPTVPP